MSSWRSKKMSPGMDPDRALIFHLRQPYDWFGYVGHDQGTEQESAERKERMRIESLLVAEKSC